MITLHDDLLDAPVAQPKQESKPVLKKPSRPAGEKTVPPKEAHKSPRRNPDLLLYRAFGPGFGTGQMLVKIEPMAPIQVLLDFMPHSLDQRFFTGERIQDWHRTQYWDYARNRWQPKLVDEDRPTCQEFVVFLDKFSQAERARLFVLEICASQAGIYTAQFYFPSGRPASWLMELNPLQVPLRMNREQEFRLNRFLGQKYDWSRRYLEMPGKAVVGLLARKLALPGPSIAFRKQVMEKSLQAKPSPPVEVPLTSLGLFWPS